MANVYPAISLAHKRRCRESNQDHWLLTIAFVIAVFAVLLFNDWVLRVQMWGALALLYLAVRM